MIAGEGSYDLQMPYYEVSYVRISRDHVPLHRYIDPAAQIMIGVFGHNDRHLINRALMYRYILSYEPRQYKGRLDEFPLTLEYGKRVDRLRQRYQELLWRGEFRHTVGARVLTGDGPLNSYSVFVDRQSGRRAVVVANPDPQQKVEIEVQLSDKVLPLISATPGKSPASPKRRTSSVASAVHSGVHGTAELRHCNQTGRPPHPSPVPRTRGIGVYKCNLHFTLPMGESRGTSGEAIAA